MNNYISQLKKCKQIVEHILRNANFLNVNGSELYNEISILAGLLPDDFDGYKQRLQKIILPNLRPINPRINHFGQIIPMTNLGVSPVALGELIATLDYIDSNPTLTIPSIDWRVIHPLIIRVSQERFNVGQYADSVEAAFKAINNEVKHIVLYTTGEEMDGSTLMQRAFNKNNPIIKLNETDGITSQDIQQGYQFMFSGAILGIRNPKAHGVESISKEEAIRELHFASMLMYKLDSRIKDSEKPRK